MVNACQFGRCARAVRFMCRNEKTDGLLESACVMCYREALKPETIKST